MTRSVRRFGGAEAILLWSAVSAVVVIAAFIVGTRVTTPWDDAQIHSQQLILATVPVEQGEIVQGAITLEGTFRLGEEVPAVVDPPADGQRVISHLALAPGDLVESGELILEISGRPLIALAFPFPLYRDIRFGDTGRDVQALQAALSDLGHYSGALDGEYGSATVRAVERLYGSVGYMPPPVDAAAQAELDDAVAALADLRAQQASNPEIVNDSEIARAVKRFEAAEEAVRARVAAGEVLALQVDSVRVVTIAPLGSVVTSDQPAIHLQAGVPSVQFRVDLASLASFVKGTVVSVGMPGDSASLAEGTVVDVSEFRAADSAREFPPGYDVTATVEPVDGWLHGATVLVTPVGSSERASGLIAPLVAVRADASGAYVLVAPAPDSPMVDLRRVPVTLGAESGGRVLIAGDITAGDLVVTAMSQ